MAFTLTHKGVLYIVLDEENIERVQQADPFEFDQSNVSGITALRVPLKIVIAYAKKDELDKIMKMSPIELQQYLWRGYRRTSTDDDRGAPYKYVPLRDDRGKKA